MIIWLKCEACLLIQLECREADSSSGEHRLPACNRWQLADEQRLFGRLPKKDRQVACAPQSLHLPRRENVGEHRLAFSRFEVGAVGHLINQARPSCGAVLRDSRQRVAFDATRSKKSASFAQRNRIDPPIGRIRPLTNMSLCSNGRHLRSYRRRRVVCRFATGKQANQREKDQPRFHFKSQNRKLCAAGNPARLRSRSLAPKQWQLQTNYCGGRKCSGRRKHF